MLSISRPRGSEAFIRIVGALEAGDPNGYGNLPLGFAPGTYPVKFLLALAPEYVQPPGSTGISDPNYRLATITYLNDPASSTQRTRWAQNTDVTIKALDNNLTDCKLASPTYWGTDPTTGSPFVVLDMTVGDDPPEIDLQIEVKHSAGR